MIQLPAQECPKKKTPRWLQPSGANAFFLCDANPRTRGLPDEY